jgi:hypothetical protein
MLENAKLVSKERILCPATILVSIARMDIRPTK